MATGLSVKFERTIDEKGLYVSGVVNKDGKDVGRVCLSEDSDRLFIQVSPINAMGKETVIGLLGKITESLCEVCGCVAGGEETGDGGEEPTPGEEESETVSE